MVMDYAGKTNSELIIRNLTHDEPISWNIFFNIISVGPYKGDWYVERNDMICSLNKIIYSLTKTELNAELLYKQLLLSPILYCGITHSHIKLENEVLY
jgi:hypothetical protein